jgi:hypothetical protein
MKKIMLTGFLFLALGSLFCEEANIARLAGTIPATGLVTEMEIMHDLLGGSYALYIADGKFNIARSGGSGRFAEYIPAGFTAPQGVARELRLSASGPVQYAAFIGSELGIERVYIFGLDYQGVLHYYPQAEITSSRGIARYEIEGSYAGNAGVYLLSGGRLSYIANIGERGQIATRQDISESGETVNDFGLGSSFGEETRYGWYRTAGTPEVTLFSLNKNGLLHKEKTGMDGNISTGITQEGAVTCVITDGTRVAVYQGASGVFSKMAAFDTDFPVARYYSASQNGGNTGLLTGEIADGSSAGLSAGSSTIYRVLYESSGAPVIREWLTGVEAYAHFFTQDKQRGLLYKQGETWCSIMLSDMTGATEKALPDGAVFCYNAGIEQPRLYALDKTGKKLLVHEFNRQRWVAVKIMDLSQQGHIEIWDSRRAGAFLYADTPLVPLVTPERLILCEPDSGRSQSIAYKRGTLSRRINGVILLAVYSGENITVYRHGEAIQ